MEFEGEGVLEFEIEAGEGGKASSFIARADIIPILVKFGIREAGMGIQDGHELEFVGKANDAPEDNAVGSITRKRAVLIGSNKRIRIVAEELVVVI